jgi:hypothetical protein
MGQAELDISYTGPYLDEPCGIADDAHDAGGLPRQPEEVV